MIKPVFALGMIALSFNAFAGSIDELKSSLLKNNQKSMSITTQKLYAGRDMMHPKSINEPVENNQTFIG